MMAISSDALELRTGDVEIDVTATGGARLSMRWEAYHDQTDTVVEGGQVGVVINSLADVESGTRRLYERCGAEYEATMAKHKAVWKGMSAFDVGLILDRWMFMGGTMAHPVCGNRGVAADAASLTSMVNAVLSVCLPPPTWAWAESAEPGKLRVKCTSVGGADGYAVYDGDGLLGSPTDLTDWVESSAASGVYAIRVAGVKAGQVGILSFPMAVEVA